MALTEAVGPVTSATMNSDFVMNPEPVANYALGVDLLAIPELAAGFAYGMIGDSDMTEMDTCYAGAHDLYGYLATALADVEAFHLIGAIEEFEKFVYHFQLDAAPCTQMQDDLAALEVYAQQFLSPTALIPTVTKHYALHRRTISADIATFKTDWAAKSFFAAGRTAADILTILVGPIQ